jgi:hypothetical protein
MRSLKQMPQQQQQQQQLPLLLSFRQCRLMGSTAGTTRIPFILHRPGTKLPQ